MSHLWMNSIFQNLMFWPCDCMPAHQQDDGRDGRTAQPAQQQAPLWPEGCLQHKQD